MERPTDKRLNKEMKNLSIAKKQSIQIKDKESVEKNVDTKEEDKEAGQKLESKSQREILSKHPDKIRKQEALAKGINLHASKKHCMYICSYIKGKPIDQSIKELQEVIKLKRIIPFKGEIPHRKGKGIMSGRYPVKVSAQFIYLLKALKGNCIANGLDIDKTIISSASASWASRPARRAGMRFKRTNVILIAKELNNLERSTEAKK